MLEHLPQKNMSEQILADYVRQAEVADTQATLLHRQQAFLKRITPWLGLAWAAAFAAAFFAQSHSAIWWTAGFIVLAATMGITFLQQRRRKERNHQRLIAAIHKDGACRINRQWSNSFYQFDLAEDDEWLSRDLDLLGHGSLFELACTAQSSGGIETLKDWFLKPADCDEIAIRQQAIKELVQQQPFLLASQIQQRQHFAESSTLDEILNWTRQETVLANSTFLNVATIVLPLTIVGSALSCFSSGVPLSVGLPIMMTAMACTTLITLFRIGPVHDVFHELLPTPTSTRLGIASLFETVAATTSHSRKLAEIQTLASEANQKLRRLKKLIQPTLLSRNPWTVIWLYFPLQVLTLWDFQWLRLVERWKVQNGEAFGDWVQAFSEFEALASLATLACDHPEWQYPSVSDTSKKVFDAKALGHPLLPDKSCVTNDVEIHPVGRMLLVTGSNMSGKSTLLRAIGLNAVLAQTGAPVCASSLSLCPLNVVTSIRIVDSLQSGVSLFMAEVNRLKRVIELARQTDAVDTPTMLFLFDEVLHGTNTSERHIALRRVLSHLLRHRVVGAITTHDLQLAEEPEILDRSQLVHFRDTLKTLDGKATMTFDYQMRPGIAPTTNALALLDLVGLGEQNADDTYSKSR